MIDALPLLLGPEGYQISRSVRLRSSASAYFNRTFTTPTNNRIFTWSGWVKRGLLGANISYPNFFGTGSDELLIYSATYIDQFAVNMAAGAACNIITTQVFRDPSAWYHIIVAVDTTQATASNRVKIYVNGVQITAFAAATYPSLNYNPSFNSATAHALGNNAGAGRPFDGYLTEINFIDGQALTPSSFGETNAVTGVWQPKKYAGTYGTNGFYLNFSDNSAATAAAIGKDYSGNGNNWTPNNISVTAGVTYDSMLDVPTQWADGGNGRGNYATLNPLYGTGITANFFLDAANLNLNVNTNAAYRNLAATFSPESFKGYFEVALTTSPNFQIGFAYESIAPSSSQYTSAGTLYLNYVGDVYNGSTAIKTGCITTPSSGDIIQVAFDFTGGARNVWFGRNGTWGSNSVGVGDPANGTNPVLTVSNIAQAARLYFAMNSGAGTVTVAANFGQRPFAYTPPTGFKALNTLNLPTPTILKGNQYFDATTYTGTGATQSIVNSGAMQPDLVWLKRRNGVGDNGLYDSVRGVALRLVSNSTGAEASVPIDSFNANGFSTTSNYNNSGETLIAWQWKEGATQGFDIVTWTGTGAAQNISHNLGVAPTMIIWKYRSSASDWAVGHTRMNNGVNPWNYWAALNSTAAQAASAGAFNNTAPTSSQFTVGSFNANATSMIAYLFAEVAGFSKAFSYTGNGSADGPFVFLGFRPKYVMFKRSDSTGSWFIEDSSRGTYNVMGPELYAESSSAEGTVNRLDFLSNGFKLRAANAGDNANGGTYIGIAFAEVPYKFALGR